MVDLSGCACKTPIEPWEVLHSLPVLPGCLFASFNTRQRSLVSCCAWTDYTDIFDGGLLEAVSNTQGASFASNSTMRYLNRRVDVVLGDCLQRSAASFSMRSFWQEEPRD